MSRRKPAIAIASASSQMEPATSRQRIKSDWDGRLGLMRGS
jgi:hypothetical protein